MGQDSQDSHRHGPIDEVDRERYLEHSFDLVARVRAAREAAQREMETFGNVAEYEIRKIYGQRTDLNYNDESVPTPAEHPVQVPDHEGSISTKSEPPAEREQLQASLDFEQHGSQQSSPTPEEEG